jgi:hypothetical protein
MYFHQIEPAKRLSDYTSVFSLANYFVFIGHLGKERYMYLDISFLKALVLLASAVETLLN